ncbi:head-tail connector protein [Stenotrophomonas sp.]|uniref:head-tail connector protein n=1 Tax=Stenotrophomonas sp. TaxID=69392 RepID=UPI00289E4C8C|nr:head-tail connector protein [Stenotrophomonas sp.]
MRLVTIEQARTQVAAMPHHDAQLQLYVGAAEQAAEDFLNRQVYATADDLAVAVINGSAGEEPIVVNDAIRAAVLLITGHLFRNREDVTGEATHQLPSGAHSLLWPHRRGLGV